MKIFIVLAAVVLGLSLTVPSPAQARMIDSGLSKVAPFAKQDVQWRHRRWHRRWHRHRHCWRGRYGRLHCRWGRW
jgi:hypothetical protein